MRDVACASPQLCFLLGWHQVGDFHQPVIVEWNGNTFVKLAIPKVAAGAALVGVGCVSATSCFAFGNPTSDMNRPILEAWDGSSWTVAKAPQDPVDNGGQRCALFQSMSCSPGGICVALADIGEPGPSFADTWNGSKWEGGACGSTSACIVEGEARMAHAEAWNGSSLSYVSLPSGNPSSMGCVFATQCFMGGDLEWTGSEWSTFSSPAYPSGSIDCLPAEHFCLSFLSPEQRRRDICSHDADTSRRGRSSIASTGSSASAGSFRVTTQVQGPREAVAGTVNACGKGSVKRESRPSSKGPRRASQGPTGAASAVF